MKKNIYIVSQTESELTQRGKRHPDLAKLLAEKNYNVTYISSNFYHADKIFFSNADLKSAQERLPYRLELISTRAYKSNFSFNRVLSNLIFAFKVYKKLKKELKENSLIIIPSRPIEILYYISKLKRKKDVEVIVDIRDVWPDAFKINNKIVSKIFTAYCNFFLNRSVSKFEKFLHVSPSFLNWLSRYSPNSTSDFIPLGYNPNRFNCEVVKPKIIVPPVKVVYIGLLQYQIDILPYIKSIENDLRFELYLYGDNGEGQRYASVFDYVNTNEIKNVFFKGKLNQDEVCIHLKKCDIGIIPMITSSMPNKIFDYLACELPIFALGKNDCSDFVNNNNIGWSSSFNVSEIKAVNDVVFKGINSDYNVKKQEVISNREKYSREILFKRIIEVIER